jgi:hypothetical protein
MPNFIEGSLNAAGLKFEYWSAVLIILSVSVCSRAVDALVRHGAEDSDLDVVSTRSI